MRSLIPIAFASFFFTAPATSSIYTLSLHDALPILVLFQNGEPLQFGVGFGQSQHGRVTGGNGLHFGVGEFLGTDRSEEHTSELQSHSDLVCRLLLEKKKEN